MTEKQNYWFFENNGDDEAFQKENDLQNKFESQDEEIVGYLGEMEQQVLEEFLKNNPQIVEGIISILLKDGEECSEFEKEIREQYAKASLEKFGGDSQSDELGGGEAEQNDNLIEEEFKPTNPEEVVIYKTPSRTEIEKDFAIQKENLKNSYITEIIKRYQETSSEQEDKILDVEQLQDLIGLIIEEIFEVVDSNPHFYLSLDFKEQIVEKLKDKYFEINKYDDEVVEKIIDIENNGDEEKFENLYDQSIKVYLEFN